ncbi:MAG: hypothetical protein KBI47_12735 [Armatimonadetes bacterium]|jgi:hypothetical protein|nr:hypothetical protein [Armatimonadota bacterium]MDI9586987.1 hypothetical protein [Acidobacteriota bacterium]
MEQNPKFTLNKYLIHQKILSLGTYHVYDEMQRPLFFVVRPALKLKAHVSIYDDDTKVNKLLELRQDKIIAINQMFTLLSPEGATIAVFERQGLFSMLRRTWKITGPDGQLIAIAQEDSWAKALIRRFLTEWIRTDFEVLLADGTKVGYFHRQFTIGDKYSLDLSADPGRRLDRRIAVGLAILLDTAEAR